MRILTFAFLKFRGKARTDARGRFRHAAQRRAMFAKLRGKWRGSKLKKKKAFTGRVFLGRS